MRTEIIAFTEKGIALGKQLKNQLEDAHLALGTGAEKVALTRWTEECFQCAQCIIFISAIGIAVRAIAPFLKSKTSDPAVIVIDNLGTYCISLLSGHIGGANEMTQKIAKLIGAEPIITTATDQNGVFAIDCWAKKHNFAIANPHEIKAVSAKLLRGEQVRLYCDVNIVSSLPPNFSLTKNVEEANVIISIWQHSSKALHLVPRIVAIGMGCRRNIPEENVETLYDETLIESGISPLAIKGVFSIDLKQEEPALLYLAQKKGIVFKCFTTEELKQIKEVPSPSDFVKATVGIDNVCERSAILGANNGLLIIRKKTANGVTISAAKAGCTINSFIE